MHHLHFHEIKSRLGLSTASLIAFVVGLVMNPAKYNSLPPDLRALLDKESGVAAAVSFGKAWIAQEKFVPPVLLIILGEPGCPKIATVTITPVNHVAIRRPALDMSTATGRAPGAA